MSLDISNQFWLHWSLHFTGVKSSQLYDTVHDLYLNTVVRTSIGGGLSDLKLQRIDGKPRTPKTCFIHSMAFGLTLMRQIIENPKHDRVLRE